MREGGEGLKNEALEGGNCRNCQTDQKPQTRDLRHAATEV